MSKQYNVALQTLETVNNADKKNKQNITNYMKIKKQLTGLLHVNVNKYVIKHHHVKTPYHNYQFIFY